MNKKIIPGIGIGIAIIVMILATQNVQIEPENNIVETNVGCVSEFKIMFPDEDESKIKDLCDNSEPIYELMNFEDISDNNSYGFRGQDFSAIKPSNTYRIFLVGGSTMWGSGSYSYETTIPGIFQKIFDKQKLETNVEVINAGFHGANSITELKLIKERLVDLQPDLIIIYDGWNDLRAEYSAEIIHNNWKSICEIGNKNNPILKNIPEKSEVYFVHSYKIMPDNKKYIISSCDYEGQKINAIVQKDKIIGCQFHPEKSGYTGLNILENILSLN